MEMKREVFESLYYVRTGEVTFKDQRDLLKDLKARILDVGRLYQAKRAIEEGLGRDLRVLGLPLKKKGKLQEEIEALRARWEGLKEKEALLEERSRDLRRLKALREEEERIRDLMADLEGRQELLERSIEKRRLQEKAKALLKEQEEGRRLRELLERRKALLPFDPSLLKEMEALREEAVRAKERLGVLEGNLADLRKLLGEKEAQEAERGRELGELSLEREQLLLRIRSLGDPHDLAQRLAELRARAKGLREEADRAKEEIREREGRVEALRREGLALRRRGRTLWILWAAGSSAAALLGLLSLLRGLWSPSVVALAVLVLLAAFPLRAALRLGRRADGISADLRGEEATLEEAKKRVEALEGDIRRLGEEEVRVLSASGLRDEGELHLRMEELNGLRQRLGALEGRIQQLQREKEALGREGASLREKERALEAEIEGQREVLRRAEEAMARRLEGMGLRNLRDLEERVREREALEARIALLEGKGVRAPEEVEGELAEVVLRLRELEDVPSEVEGEGEIRAALEGTRQEYLAVAQEISAIEGRLAERERLIGMGEGEFFRELKVLEQRIADLEDRRRAYLTIYEALEEVERRLDGELMALIRGRAKEWFSFVVGERVKDIVLLENDMKVVLDGRELSPKELSTGTRDTLYLCARVAIAERAKGLRTLLLDDPFITCDPDRTQRLLGVLERLSEGFQILLATKDPGLREWASQKGARIIDLKGGLR